MFAPIWCILDSYHRYQDGQCKQDHQENDCHSHTLLFCSSGFSVNGAAESQIYVLCSILDFVSDVDVEDDAVAAMLSAGQCQLSAALESAVPLLAQQVSTTIASSPSSHICGAFGKISLPYLALSLLQLPAHAVTGRAALL